MLDLDIDFETSEIGGKPTNQDRHAFFIDNEASKSLVVVADGVGGSADGAVAAEIITKIAESLWNSRGGFASGKLLLESLIKQATAEILEKKSAGLNTASTICAIAFWPDKITSVHAGDSRICQYQSGKFVNQTNDHSLAYSKFKMGEISKEELATHPTQNQLLSCLDGSEAVVEYNDWDSSVGETFVVCSDGFWEIFDDESLGQFCEQKDKSMIFANRFEDMLAQYPKHDNTTVVIAKLVAERTAKKQSSAPVLSQSEPKNQQQDGANSMNKILLGLVVGLIIVLLAWIVFGGADNSLKSEQATNKKEPVATEKPATTNNKAKQGQEAENAEVNEDDVDDNAEIETSPGDNDDEGNGGVDGEADITEGLDSVDGIEITIDPNKDLAQQIKDKLVDDGVVSKASEIVVSDEQKDQYATLREMKLKLKGIPIYGAEVKLIKTETGFQIVTGKLVNLEAPSGKPKNSFMACVEKNADFEPSEKSTKDSLFIDAKTGGYLWQNIARHLPSTQAQKVLFYDADCSVKLLEPLIISSIN